MDRFDACDEIAKAFVLVQKVREYLERAATPERNAVLSLGEAEDRLAEAFGYLKLASGATQRGRKRHPILE